MLTTKKLNATLILLATLQAPFAVAGNDTGRNILGSLQAASAAGCAYAAAQCTKQALAYARLACPNESLPSFFPSMIKAGQAVGVTNLLDLATRNTPEIFEQQAVKYGALTVGAGLGVCVLSFLAWRNLTHNDSSSSNK